MEGDVMGYVPPGPKTIKRRGFLAWLGIGTGALAAAKAVRPMSSFEMRKVAPTEPWPPPPDEGGNLVPDQTRAEIERLMRDSPSIMPSAVNCSTSSSMPIRIPGDFLQDDRVVDLFIRDHCVHALDAERLRRPITAADRADRLRVLLA
jgi:hypothetical protein